MRESGYRKIADDLRAAIGAGRYEPGQTIPTESEIGATYGVNRTTARRAIALLRAEGLVVPIKRRGTVVRDTTRVTVPFSRYAAAMQPAGQRGPWETACASQGIDGRTEVVLVEQVQARDDVAERLGLPANATIVHRRRHMWAGPQIAQIQDSWLPFDLVKDTPLAGEEKIVGGLYRALEQIGHPAATVDESVQARMPTPTEAELMHLDQGSPVIAIDRLTRDAAGSPLEFLQVIAVGDRVRLVYEGLPLAR